MATTSIRRAVSRWAERLRFAWSLRRFARRGASLVILQSCDRSYRPLLEISGPVNRAYADRHGYGYLKFVGNLSRVPETANFNRYYLLGELLCHESFHWAAWLDADAIVVDHRRTLESIIERSPKSMVIACRGANKGEWDINNGVFLLNLRHPLAAAMLDDMIAACERLGRDHRGFSSDQRLMHDWLKRQLRRPGESCLVTRYTGAEADLFNYGGPFIKHVLREYGSLEVRASWLRKFRDRIAT